jgi:hypothetical protein
LSLALLLRAAGASLVVLSLFHAVLWRVLAWDREVERLSPLNARIFAVHTFFVAFVLGAVGLLSLVRPDLLLAPSELARLLLAGLVVFWLARFALQPIVFDPVMRHGWMRRPFVRAGASLLWASYVAVFGAALLRQCGLSSAIAAAPFDVHSHVAWLRYAIAAVWLVFGLLLKALGAVPRHREIVARVVGAARAPLVFWLVALGEIGLGAWMLAGVFLPACMAVQTVLLVAMNALELRHARDLLVAPVGMVCANVALLSLGWYVALAGT